ncbi:MAG: 50S ribosomal protein L3 [Ignavibacteriae bacterium]|nr:50S ribosomal protein L3 [Ignavibacteriota bacterium]
MPGLLGKKIGMTNVFSQDGNFLPVTILEVGPCKIFAKKTIEKDGYKALQLGFGQRKNKNLNNSQKVFFAKMNSEPANILREFKNYSNFDELNVGEDLNTSLFNEGDKVTVTGTTKGKGFQGVMRRHGFGGVGGTTHGQSDRLRAPGSIGASSFPSRVFKGQRMAGRTGNDKKTLKSVKIVKIIPDKNLILVKGPVPGAINSIIEINK